MRRCFRVILKLQIIFLLLIVIGLAFFFFGGYARQVEKMWLEAREYVENSTSETFRTNQTTIVYGADGKVISTLKGNGEAYYLALEDIPSEAVAAIISIEDKKFYRHDGVDYRAILRAVKAMLESGEATQGGSTITMQLARGTFLTQEKTWQRKVEEILISWELEKKYSKDEILEYYLNNIYFGNGHYGIQSASRGYFNRDVSELSLSEIAFLCAIPNNPTLYDPLKKIDNTLARRNRILANMENDGKISGSDYANAIVAAIQINQPETLIHNDYVETYIYYCAARMLMEQEGFTFRCEFATEEEQADYQSAYETLYSECISRLYTSGYRIYTSIDLILQEELQCAVDETLKKFTETNAEGVYALQAAAVCIENESGHVKAIVGGRKQDFRGYTLNRAYQSFRQPGSAIKPLTVYTPAFEQDYYPESRVVDEPMKDGPKNSDGIYDGEMTVRQAVENSVNTIAWKLYGELTPERGLFYLKEMNFSKLDKEDYRLSTALGGFTNGVSALEMAAGYAALENDGIYRAPTCIEKILDAYGNEIVTVTREEKQIYEENAAHMMTDVLSGVLTRGTARGLDLGDMPAAGKTGTTNDQKDGWFVGYTGYYTTSVWVGCDMPKKMEDLMGSTYPGKIWQTFMWSAHEGLEPLKFLPYDEAEEVMNILQSQAQDTVKVVEGEVELLMPAFAEGETE